MGDILSQLRLVAEDLRKLEIRWALVGGLAVSVYSEPRTTRDIDIAIAIDASAEKQFSDSLLALGYSHFQLLMRASPVQKLGFRVKARGGSSTTVVIDFLSSSSGIEREIVNSPEEVEIFPELSMPIVKLGYLLAMKVVAHNDVDRIQDKVDIVQLLRVATNADLALTREALRLVTERKYNRGVDLLAQFDEELRRSGKG